VPRTLPRCEVGQALAGFACSASRGGSPGAITFVEPAVDTVLHDFFERYWSDRRWTARLGALKSG